MVRIGINGLGRIGRVVFRLAMLDPHVEVVAVNNRSGGKDFCQLLQYDTIYGKAPYFITQDSKGFVVDGKCIPFYNESDPAKIPWKKHAVDVVIESTGVFTDGRDAKKHLKAGAHKVLITAPAEHVDFDMLLGVNQDKYNSRKHHIISNQSCTTNCATPLAYVLQKEFGIETAYMLTAHAYTSTQSLLDNYEHDLRRSRAAALNIVPTTTGAAEAVLRIMPALKGRMTGLAIRVPVACGSLLTLVAHVKKKTTEAQVNHVMREAARTYLHGILEYSELPLVSSMILANPHSVIYDSQLTRVQRGNFVEVVGWYDNEWGYAARCIDVAKLL